MKTTRIISLCLAIITILALVGCNQNTPEETTGSVITTEAPVLDVTEPEATEPEVTEPQFPEYAGPSSDFKFSLASVLSANNYASYTDFLPNVHTLRNHLFGKRGDKETLFGRSEEIGIGSEIVSGKHARKAEFEIG